MKDKKKKEQKEKEESEKAAELKKQQVYTDGILFPLIFKISYRAA